MKTNLKAKKGFNKIHVQNKKIFNFFFLTMLKLFLTIIKLHDMIYF